VSKACENTKNRNKKSAFKWLKRVFDISKMAKIESLLTADSSNGKTKSLKLLIFRGFVFKSYRNESIIGESH
jgi:hypothetical protein